MGFGMEFLSLDVETANPDLASICQVGIVRFSEGRVAEEWVTYVDPEDYFDPINVSIHGISESVVADAPKWIDLHDRICETTAHKTVITHTAFDRIALARICEKNKVHSVACTWLDSSRVARRAWEQFSRSGYGLRNVCEELNIGFKHHDALEDAKAAGHIMLAAIECTGLDLDAWLRRVAQPIGLSTTTSGRIERDGNPEGPLYGEVLAFTGALQIPRREAADMAAQIGCSVAGGVNKKVTMLVVGDQDVARLAGHEKSSKHRKVEELILRGQPIRILKESDFRELVSLSA